MQPIFRDDSSERDMRDTAIDRLLSLCPAQFRLLFRDQVVKAIDATPASELTAFMREIDELQRIAATGDVEQLTTAAEATARRFGAGDAQLAQVRQFTSFMMVPGE